MAPKPTPFTAERSRRDAAPKIASAATPALRLVPSTGAVRVLENRRAPAQLSLFQRALPAR